LRAQQRAERLRRIGVLMAYRADDAEAKNTFPNFGKL
jgi:hypothetical protein